MGLTKELLEKTSPRSAVKELLDDKAKQIVKKGIAVSVVDIYNLCIINKERDELEALPEEVLI